MPFLVAAVLRANERFSSLDGFNPDVLLEQMGDADTLGGAAENLGLFNDLSPVYADDLRQFLAQVPPALNAAAIAGMRSALSRGLRCQITWEPGYDFELRAWEVSDGAVGLVNIFLATPNPVETAPS
jgi:hypothetical protein